MSTALQQKPCPCRTVIELQAGLQEHERELARGSTSFALLKNGMEDIKADLIEIKKDVKTMQQKPGRQWESVMQMLINTGLAILMAFMAAKLGLV